MQLGQTILPTHDRIGTQRLLNELALDLTRQDAKLENMVRSGASVGHGWGDWFDGASNRLLAGRDAYVALNPHDGELVARLGDELLDLSQNGGRIAAAEQHGTTLGNGWSSVLDDTIDVVQQAVDRLYDVAPTPPAAPPVPPVTPPHPVGSGEVVRDAAQAAKLVRRSLETIRSLPTHDAGTAGSKDARIAAYDLNMDAQQLIEPHLASNDEFVASQLRSADASLEDANWQLARKPSPDGRFNGVDIPGAQRDTDAAAVTLEQLISALSSGA